MIKCKNHERCLYFSGNHPIRHSELVEESQRRISRYRAFYNEIPPSRRLGRDDKIKFQNYI